MTIHSPSLVRRRYPSARAVYRDGCWLVVVPVAGGLRVLGKSDLSSAEAWARAAREVEGRKGVKV